MTIKAKLSLLISIIVTIILSLNLSIYYYSTKTELVTKMQQEMITIAKQIGTSLDAAEKSKKFMEETIGEKLRAVAIAAKTELDPRIENVSNHQLAELSRELGVNHISLWKRTKDDIVVFKSSEPNEINIGSKTWDYWYKAFDQLLDQKRVTVPQGQKLLHFWSGPYEYATSDPDKINKWGYYYDGTTDYIINPYISAKVFLDYENTIGTTALIRNLMNDNRDILGITGFNPDFFGKPQIVKVKRDKIVYNLDVRGVPFGDYAFIDKKQDVKNVLQAARTGEIITTMFTRDGQEVMKSFIPLSEEMPYVISVNFDYGANKQALNHQLFIHAIISLCLIVASWFVSYLISGFLIRPLRHILDYVNEIAEGKFGRKIAIRSQDELGLLSSRVNAMADNLQKYMGRLQASAEELRSTKEYLESFVNHTSDAIHVTDLDGRVIQINDAFQTMYGWSGEEVLHQTLGHIPDRLQQEYNTIRKRIELGESLADYETVRYRKDGQVIDISITVSPIRDEKKTVIAIAEISRNITARKQSEEVIRRSEKLSVIGQLAAGVAHEIRNPLTTLRGFVQLNKQQGSLSNSYLDIMISELDRINFIVGEFLVLAKPQVSHYELVDVRGLLNDMVTLLDSQASLNNVKFDTRFAADIPLLLCEPNQLKQVFINIIKNSLEAMQDQGGLIIVELENDPAYEAVVIRFKDQGRGISEKDMARLGEPFFTSKPSGNGLGLMVSQRIIANHKGTMNITSKLGEGTCVEIRLTSQQQ